MIYYLDVSRNLDFFKIEDKITGQSIISKAYNVSIEEFNNVFSEDLDNKANEIVRKYDDWLQNSNLFSDEIKYEIHKKIVDNNSISKNIKNSLNDLSTFSDPILDDYCRIGIIIEITKKLISNKKI